MLLKFRKRTMTLSIHFIMITRNISLLLLSLKILFLAKGVLCQHNSMDVTYEDLEKLNATCEDLDNCKKERSRDDVPTYNCICGEFCSQSNTCCVDSKYRNKYTTSRNVYNCVTIYGDWPNSVYMIDTCDSSWNSDKRVEELCTSRGEDLDDLFLHVPVTNPATRTTYKNYFCSVCNYNVDEEQLVYWNLWLRSNSEEVTSTSVPEMHYNSSNNRWTVGYASENSSLKFVDLKFIAPDQLTGNVFECLPDVISDCASNWADASTREKCHSYMALVSVTNETRKTYHNPHCAICNFEKLENRICLQERGLSFGASASNTFFIRLFSLYDKENKCDDSMVFDTIAKKCRKVYKG